MKYTLCESSYVCVCVYIYVYIYYPVKGLDLIRCSVDAVVIKLLFLFHMLH